MQKTSPGTQALTARIADQRLRVAQLMDEVQPLIALADKGVAAAKFIRANAAWLGLGMTVLGAIRLGRRHSATQAAWGITATSALLWARRGVMAYQALQGLRRLHAQEQGRRTARQPLSLTPTDHALNPVADLYEIKNRESKNLECQNGVRKRA